jgi:hypothetical protein
MAEKTHQQKKVVEEKWRERERAGHIKNEKDKW